MTGEAYYLNADRRYAEDNAGSIFLGRVGQEVYRYFTARAAKAGNLE